MGQRSPDLAVAGTDPGGAASGPPDPVHRRAGPRAGTVGETGVLAEPPPPQRKLASTPRPQRDGSLRGTERKPESALFSPSPVVGQEQPRPVCVRVPETESSESDASDEPGPREDPPHLGVRPALDLEGDPEAAELDQEEAGGAEPPSAQHFVPPGAP